MGLIDPRCHGCFQDRGAATVCPRCGFDEQARPSPIALPPRSRLQNNFIVGRVLGRPGGFGITYLGWDIHLETRVAIKEYLPRDLAGRDSDRRTVVLHSLDDTENFSYGLDLFLKEARTLAKFNHPRVVRVRAFFQENGTAYLVMDYIEGISLAEFLERLDAPLTERQALDVLMPILDGVGVVHRQGFLHRDIKPQNIFLTAAREPILLDFGAARVALGEKSRSLSVILTPGYAPYEQYHRRGEQGPWTDIYACAATLYHMVTRQVPPDALEREKGDTLEPPQSIQPGLSAHFCRTLLRALATDPAARPRSVAEFQAGLRGLAATSADVAEPTIALPIAGGSLAPSAETAGASTTAAVGQPRPPAPRRAAFWLVATLAAAGLLIAGGVAAVWLLRPEPAPPDRPAAAAAGGAPEGAATPLPQPSDAGPASQPAPPAGTPAGSPPDAARHSAAPATPPAGAQPAPATAATNEAARPAPHTPPPVPAPADTVPAGAAAPREPLRLSEPELRARLRDYSIPSQLKQRVRTMNRFIRASCLVPIEILVSETGEVVRATPGPSKCPANVGLVYAEAVRHWRFDPTTDPAGAPVPVTGVLHIPFPPPEQEPGSGSGSTPRR
jgi:hypothetical protein